MKPLADWYHGWIIAIGDGTGWSDTVLHIHAGMAVLMLARLFTGRSLGSFTPLAFVVVAELGNEVLDRIAFGSWRWGDTISDIIHTLFWPTAICIAIRLRPLIKAHRSRH